MTFEFATAGRILFGHGTSRQAPTLARDLGRRALVVLGGSGRGGEALMAGLEQAGVRSSSFRVNGEPTTHLVDEAIQLARIERFDLVIALGGGSVIDAAKAVAGLTANSGVLLDYLEMVGRGKPLPGPGLPFIAIPTTAGTGAEVTRNAVLESPEQHLKVSLRSPHLLPRLAIIDPELTRSMPPEITAYTGMDAFTQLIEPFVSNAANPLIDGICREGLERVARSLKKAFRDGSDLSAREDMALAALFGGLALANARLGAVHGFAGVLGGSTGWPHGAICARLLPYVMEANLRAIATRGDPAIRRRYDEIARILSGDPSADAQDGVSYVHELCAELKIPPLRESGLAESDFDRMIPLARRASSMRGNPVELTEDELRGILNAAI